MSAIYMEEMRSQWIKHPRSQRDDIVQKVGINDTLSSVLKQVPFTLCVANVVDHIPTSFVMIWGRGLSVMSFSCLNLLV